MDLALHPIVLTALQLAHFVEPKTWPQIFMLEPRMTRGEWRAGVIEADGHGRGLLQWSPGPRLRTPRKSFDGTWQLTPAGAALVRQPLGGNSVQ